MSRLLGIYTSISSSLGLRVIEYIDTEIIADVSFALLLDK
jgi:hypothetical protein